MHIDDILKKLKIKMIVKDFSQMHEIDYTNTFVSIMKFDTFRLFFVIVILKNLKCYQMNINNIFTKSFLKKVIYITFLLDFDLFFEQILLIRRNLYEFKQAARD